MRKKTYPVNVITYINKDGYIVKDRVVGKLMSIRDARKYIKSVNGEYKRIFKLELGGYETVECE